MLVQFGNKWIQKIPLTAKLDSAYGLVQLWLSSEFFSIQLFPNWTACSPITYTNRKGFLETGAYKNSGMKMVTLWVYMYDDWQFILFSRNSNY